MGLIYNHSKFKIHAFNVKPFSVTDAVPEQLSEFIIPGSFLMVATSPTGCLLNQVIEVDEVCLLFGVYNTKEDVSILISSALPLFINHITIKGNTGLQIKNLGQYYFTSSHFAFVFSSQFLCTLHLKKNQQYIFLDISYPLNYVIQKLNFYPLLESFKKDLQSIKPTLLFNSKYYLNAEALEIIYKILHAPYFPNLRSFHTDLLNTLLQLQLRKMADIENKSPKFFINDIEQIRAAKQFIDSNLPKHFSIFQIARKIGLNEQKLKHGFKQVFGVSIYAYLQNEIFKIAKEYIEQTNKSVKEIAIHANYKTANNFTAAFKKKFGISPIKWRKQFKDKIDHQVS